MTEFIAAVATSGGIALILDCVIHHERDVREEQKYICVVRTSNNRVIPMM